MSGARHAAPGPWYSRLGKGVMRWLLQRRQWVLVAGKSWGFGYWRKRP